MKAKRIQIDQIEPDAYKAIFGLEHYLAKTNLLPEELVLIKIRASQINNCAFCINMHSEEALKLGIEQKKLNLIQIGKNLNLFSAKEKSLLKMAEEITLIHKGGLSETTYQNALEYFSENQIAQIIMAVATINVWNRIAVSTLKPIG